MAKKQKKIDVVDLATGVAQWCFGDNGPFGWNDHANCQKHLHKMDPVELNQFLDVFTSQFRIEFTRKIRED